MDNVRRLWLVALAGLLLLGSGANQQGGQIGYGETVEGRITGEDGERWTFNGREGDEVRIDMRSDDIDAYVELLDEDDSYLAGNDDTIGSDARIQAYVLPATGSYTIVAMSYFTDETGLYAITLERTGVGVELVTGGGELGYGDSVRAQVSDEYGDEWTFEGEAGDQVRISMSSPAIDSYLELLAPDGSYILGDEDSGSEFNALIDGYVLPESGTYTIVATGLGQTGQYALSLERTATSVELTVGGGPVQFGQTVSGTLITDLGDTWTFDGGRGDVVRITMRSEEFDTFLELWGPDGNLIADNDDAYEETNAVIENIWLPRDGTYSIVARAFSSETGEYELELERQNTAIAGNELLIAGGILGGVLLCLLGLGVGLLLGVLLARSPRPPADPNWQP